MTLILNILYFANKNQTRDKYPVYLIAGVVMDVLMLSAYAAQTFGQ